MKPKTVVYRDTGEQGGNEYIYRLTNPAHPDGIWTTFPGDTNKRSPYEDNASSLADIPVGGFDYLESGDKYADSTDPMGATATDLVKINADLTPLDKALKNPTGKANYCTSVSKPAGSVDCKSDPFASSN